MNNRILIFGIATIAAIIATTATVSAQSGSVMTDSHIQQIKQNCKAATRTVQQIHVNDAPLRVNRGQVYDSISTKLMTPLNSRLIVNKLDASELVKVTAQYDKTLSEFRENYKKYDNQMSAVLQIDCVKQPVTFYDAVAEARQMRANVHSSVTKLHSLITEYGDAFTTFRGNFSEGRVKGES